MFFNPQKWLFPSEENVVGVWKIGRLVFSQKQAFLLTSDWLISKPINAREVRDWLNGAPFISCYFCTKKAIKSCF